MTTTDTTVQNLVINQLSQAQYEGILNPSSTELYLTPDESAEKDLSNVNATGTSTGANWAMPSSTYDDLTVGASGATYTAPANGYFCIKISNYGNTGNYQAYYTTSYGGRGQLTAYSYCSFGGAIVPMLKGQTLEFHYEGSTADRSIRFVYAKGSESEAS